MIWFRSRGFEGSRRSKLRASRMRVWIPAGSGWRAFLSSRASDSASAKSSQSETEFKAADLPRDIPLLIQAHKDAAALVKSDPVLKRPAYAAIRTALRERYRESCMNPMVIWWSVK